MYGLDTEAAGAPGRATDKGWIVGSLPQIGLDRSSPVPLYHQVASQLETAVVDGTLAPGDRIVNEIELAGRLGLSRPTMRQAIQVLVDKGMLVRKRGVGTQVVGAKIRRPFELTSLHDDLLRSGQSSRTEVLGCEVVGASDDLAHELQVRSGSPVWSLRRLRSVHDEPFALMHNFLPVELVNLRDVDLSTVGLYQLLRRNGVHLRVANQSIGARRAAAREARLLAERRGAPLVTMTRTAFDDAGRAVEHGDHVYRADRYTVELTLVDR